MAIFNLDEARVDRRLLWRLTDRMAFRGPDGEETWIGRYVGLGHTMLRTTRESENEIQPCSLDGKTYIAADARVDGREELVAKLSANGRNASLEAPDAALILHAFSVWGEDCLEHLIGDFAFAIWDGRNSSLFCARDQLGVKPFYYHESGRRVIAGNTLEPLRLHPGVSGAPLKEDGLWYSSPQCDDGGQPVLRVWRTESSFQFRYSFGPGFVVNRDGAEVRILWPEAMPLSDAVTYLSGPILGFILRLRGVTCLHGSAVETGGRALILIGPSGAGKSTTAAALCRLGCRLVSENAVAVLSAGEQFRTCPGYPRFNLWPDSSDLLFGSADLLPRISPEWEKRFLDLSPRSERFHNSSLRFGAIYALEERSEHPSAPFVSPLSPAQSLITLIGNTYLSYLPDLGDRSRDLKVLGQLCNHVPVRKVTPHADGRRLGLLCKKLIADAAAHVRLPRDAGPRTDIPCGGVRPCAGMPAAGSLR